jgi:hypothetical protein
MTASASSPTSDRAVVTDDGTHLYLAVYAIDPPSLTTATLEPLQAIRLARELLDGGLRHLWRERR